MAGKTRDTQDPSSDDDAPEAVSHSTSKADAKRAQKALRDVEVEAKARRKARNRERDHKLKERARVTRDGRPGGKLKRIRFADQVSEEEGESDGADSHDDVEARMLKAMRDAADEMEGGEDEDEGEFMGFGQGMDLGDDTASQDEDDEDASIFLGDLAAQTDDEEMDEDEDVAPGANIRRPSKQVNYLPDDLFAAAFASQSSKPAPKKNTEASTRQEIVKKRRRKSNTRPKDLIIGGRTIRTLPHSSDPRSQATARTVPSARVRKFVDRSLAMKGKQGLLKAKKKGWERRPVNIGVMKYHGAPHGFVRNTQR